MTNLEAQIVFLYSGFLMMQVFVYTSVLDGKNYALIGEYFKLGLSWGILFYLDFSWFGLRGIFVVSIILYLCISLTLTYYFLKQKALN